MTRLEWYECRECGTEYTWFSIEVTDWLELFGWLHRWDVGCERQKPMDLRVIQ